ncbi:hypothetical protein MTO96_000620 [Rhipicephalus appendiculatus]
METGETCGAWSMPSGGSLCLLGWLLVWPGLLLMSMTIPDCRQPRFRMWFPLTFVAAIIWVGLLSYFSVWMVTVIGDTFGIPETVSGITLLAIGTSMPEAITSVIVAKNGLGNMALCNLLGSNVFDILFCLGGPWLVKAAFFSPDQHKVIFSSAGVSFSAAVLLTLVLILYLFLAGFRWKLDFRVGLACLLLYAAYIVIACMYEMNVFGVVNNLLCLRFEDTEEARAESLADGRRRLTSGGVYTALHERSAMTARIVDGVLQSPFTLDDYEGISAPQLIRDRLQRYADKVIAIDVDTHLTGAELLHRIRRSAAGFSREGVKKGTKPSQVMEKISLKGFAVGEIPGFVNVLRFQTAGDESWPSEDEPVDTAEDIVVILYTSGSTGLPKGVEISHRAYVATFASFRRCGFMTEDDVYLAWNPLTHVSGFTLNIFAPCYGATTILREPSLPLDRFLDVVRTYGITALVGVPVKMQMFINEAKSSGRKLPHLEKMVFAGSTMSSSLVRDLCEMMTPSTLANLYGMTETFGLVSATKADEITVEHMGLPCAGSEVKVVDVNSGKLLEPFEHGEICVRSPNVMKGYHLRPEETAEVLDSDGWLRTGDLGYYDREGHLYMVERLKQLIKCMDTQLAPSELEEILLTHDAVAEVAVVGVPSAKYGEAPAACVVLNTSYAEPHDIRVGTKELFLWRNFFLFFPFCFSCAGQTAVYKYLYGGVIFLDSLPKAENGKVLKKKLLAMFANKAIV